MTAAGERDSARGTLTTQGRQALKLCKFKMNIRFLKISRRRPALDDAMLNLQQIMLRLLTRNLI